MTRTRNPSELYREQYEAVRDGRSDRVILYGEIRAIPEWVFDLPGLADLNLAGTRITRIPSRIADLPCLRHLDLRHTLVRDLGPTAGLKVSLDWETYLRCRSQIDPGNVERIDVPSGVLPSGPETHLLNAFLRFRNLRSLSIMPSIVTSPPTTAVQHLIDNIDQLSPLTAFGTHDLTLERVPQGLRRHTSLVNLHLINARISELPDWFEELQMLRFLDITNNPFTAFPSEVFALRDLRELHIGKFRAVSGNIPEIPGDILRLDKLETLSIYGHDIRTPPPEVVANGPAAIRAYWAQRHESNVDYLCEAKLLLLGEAGAGKTTLARKLLNPDYQLIEQPATDGIEVSPYTFPTSIRVTESGTERMLPRDYRVNIWDFGGQEIYHATHQFFLTKRSLYALICDDRKEDTDFNYWMQVVELLSDNSPLLIVQNEKQDRGRALDTSALRARFVNLKGTHAVNLATNKGLHALVKVLRDELERLPHIGTVLPATWKRVRERLEADPRNHIDSHDFLQICTDAGFRRDEDKLQLSGYLHDLGIILHFQDDPVLKRTVVLKPKWGTDAVYRVLDDKRVLAQHGRFDSEDVQRIWSADTYAPMRDELLRLMIRFQLCYELPSGGAWIAPQLLSPTQPLYVWTDEGTLRFRYEYDFMPKGLVTRLIVRLHHLIPDHDLVWRSGVVLQKSDTRAEIIEDYGRRRITVRIEGPDVRALLGVVDDALEHIHASFPRLKFEKHLPCVCDVCRTTADHGSYTVTDLHNAVCAGSEIQCRRSYRMQNAAALLWEFMPGALPHHDIPMRLSAAPQPVRKEVFVSYAWTDESKAVVDRLQEALREQGIVLIRDRNELKYKAPIRAFMQRIGRGKAVVVVLSRKYFLSKSCMFELTQIAAGGDAGDRIFPVILEDAAIDDPLTRLDYISWWESARDEVEKKLNRVGRQHLTAINSELDLYADIRSTLDNLMETLADMNALTPQEHMGSNFGELIRRIQARLSGE